MGNRLATVAGVVLVGLLGTAGCTSEGVEPTRSVGFSSASAIAVADPLLPYATKAADVTTDQRVAAALDREFAEPGYADLRSVIVLAEGRTVYERYFSAGPEDAQHVYSVTKSVLGTLVGIAIEQGRIPGLQATVGELLPDYADQLSPEQAAVTVERLLTMTGGFLDNPPGLDGQSGHPDWIASLIEYSGAQPADSFAYSNGGSHLLAVLLAEATGQSVFEYAKAVLFEPLGIDTAGAIQPVAEGRHWEAEVQGPAFGWAQDPMERTVGSAGLLLRARDMAKIGLLHLQDGVWQGEQILPTAWVEAATDEQVEAGDGLHYGYLWWTDTGQDTWFAASGYGGQGIHVEPDIDLVIVTQIWIDPEIGNEQSVAQEVHEALNSIVLDAYER